MARAYGGRQLPDPESACSRHARPRDGCPTLAEERLRRALPLAREYGGYFAIEIVRLLVESLLRQDRLADARDVATPALEDVAHEDAAALAAARMTEGAIAGASGDGETAKTAFAEALVALDGIQARIEIGEAHLAFADALDKLGDGTGAHAELRLAEEAFAEVGARGPLAIVAGHLGALDQRAEASAAPSTT